MQKKGHLYLIPNSISDNHEWIYPHLKKIIRQIDRFLAETPKTARRFIKVIDPEIHLESLEIISYNKDTHSSDIENLIAPLKNSKHIGILTDAGIPGIADPGNLAILKAHEWGVEVKPLVGPSSLFLALSASGLNGQQFTFHGYLPVQQPDLSKKIKELEKRSKGFYETQIFIETPYRNSKIFEQLLKTLQPYTYLSIAYDLTGTQEKTMTKQIRDWRKNPFTFLKLPCVFLILAP